MLCNGDELVFFFKQKTAYEMRISDWVQTCALPIFAHHRDRLLGLEIAYGVDLLIGHQVAPRLVDPDFGRDRFRYFLLIPRDHDHPSATELAELGNRRARRPARRVHHAAPTQVAFANTDPHRSAPLLAQLGNPRPPFVQTGSAPART